ncbi:me-53 [Sucra jujuba nucleopolyhedrovirus]|uniref:Me-53 n=1 Tax=Sucra jujuba nucleopolyhedrovirus TaxID=1563660 RepID=A0A097P8U9_9ABAC|nr:me-53 [Sucra jujuba nucleopolyhedrovirus]AIU41255.1 me-53 [Sucra jujuba nucleopolyhedrovirus]
MFANMIRKFAFVRDDKIKNASDYDEDSQLYGFDIDNPVFGSAPIDLRPYFLNKQILLLMMGILKYARNYISSAYSLNDCKMMNCDKLKKSKSLECVNACDNCNENFCDMPQPVELYLEIDEKHLLETSDLSRQSKYRMVCRVCARKRQQSQQTAKPFATFQLFPCLTMETAEQLCVFSFVTKYLFPVDLSYTTNECVLPKRDELQFNVYESFKDALLAKSVNEQITKISVVTYEETLLSETLDGCHLKYENGKIVLGFEPEHSRMLQFVKTHKFNKNLSYFYYVYKRVYKTFDCDYVLYFCKPYFTEPVRCKKCKNKYLKNNKDKLILYCSRCGFVNRLNLVGDDAIPKNVKFQAACVKVYKTKRYCIVYYDCSLK